VSVLFGVPNLKRVILNIPAFEELGVEVSVVGVPGELGGDELRSDEAFECLPFLFLFDFRLH
jgi:hypothetical protein